MIDKRLFRFPKVKQLLIMLAGLTILQAFIILLQCKYLSEALVLSWKQQPLNSIIEPSLKFFVCFLIRHLLNWAKKRLISEQANEMSESIRTEILKSIYEIGPKMISQKGTGSLVTKEIDGIDQINNYINLIFEKMINLLIIPGILLIYIYHLDLKSGIVLTVLVPLIILFMIILGYAAQDKADRQYNQYTLLSNHFLDSLRGLPTLKMLGISKNYSSNIFKVSEDYRKSTMSTLKVAILSSFALDWFITLSIAIIAVFLGVGLINGSIYLFSALTVLILAPEYFIPLREFASDYHATLDGKNAMNESLNVIENLPKEQNRKSLANFEWNENSNLRIKNLTFQYTSDSGKTDLQDINFTAHGYQNIGIIGESGAGKSTLINVLGGFLANYNPDEKQSIEINGQKIDNFAQDNWQSKISYIPQSPYIFSGTIRENISFYKSNATKKEVEAAAEAADLTSFINSLDDGLETVIGSGGRGISGGQAQRISLARSFLDSKRNIILLDEPTAHLDIETEYYLKKTIKKTFNNHLVFFATHRLHWINEMDYILVMKDGSIIEQGTGDELIQKNGYFVDLVKQMRGEEL